MEKYRFNLELTPGAKKQLDNLQKRTEAASITEVIRRALAVYDALEQHKRKNWDIVLRNTKKGVEKTVCLV
jgi:signal recognition particle GTPase